MKLTLDLLKLNNKIIISVKILKNSAGHTFTKGRPTIMCIEHGSQIQIKC